MTPRLATLACRPDQAMPTSSSSVTRSSRATPACDHHGMGAGHGAAAAEAVVRARTSHQASAPGHHPSTGLRQGTCNWTLPKRAWRTVTWREGTAEHFFLRGLRVCVFASARRDFHAQREPTGRMAVDRVAERSRADEVLALDPSRDRRPAGLVDTSPNCAGASSATIRNSSRRSASATTKGAAGAASITTRPCASQPTAS